jgi:hypothetical protein
MLPGGLNQPQTKVLSDWYASPNADRGSSQDDLIAEFTIN